MEKDTRKAKRILRCFYYIAFSLADSEGALISRGSSGGKEGVWNKSFSIGISLPFKKIDPKVLQRITREIGRKILQRKGGKIKLVFDGTGFSFNEVYPLKFYRGRETRRVKSHVRLVTVIGVLEDNKRVVLGEAAGKAYSSEIKLLKEALKSLPYEEMDVICAIGDKGFDSIEIMEYLHNQGIIPAIAVKETFRMEVRDELRKMSKESYKIYGRDRYLIESLYGTVKQSIGSHFKVKLEDIAIRMALCTMILYNLYLAIMLGVIRKNLFVTYFLPQLPHISPITCTKKMEC